MPYPLGYGGQPLERFIIIPFKCFVEGAKDPDGVEARRKGLEHFLMRVVRHPVLSCTKLFHAFLTAKDDKVVINFCEALLSSSLFIRNGKSDVI